MRQLYPGNNYWLTPCLFLLLLLTSTNSNAQKSSEIVHRVYLTGNTADISKHSTFGMAVNKLISSSAESFSFLINVDLISEKISIAIS